MLTNFLQRETTRTWEGKNNPDFFSNDKPIFHSIHWIARNVQSFSVTRGRALTICTEISVENFRQMVLVFFWHRKQQRDWFVPFTKHQLSFRFLWTWSLALVIQTNGTDNFPVGEKWMRDERTPKDVCGEVILSRAAIYLVCNSKFCVGKWNPIMVLLFKWNLFSNTFTLCYFI